MLRIWSPHTLLISMRDGVSKSPVGLLDTEAFLSPI